MSTLAEPMLCLVYAGESPVEAVAAWSPAMRRSCNAEMLAIVAGRRSLPSTLLAMAQIHPAMAAALERAGTPKTSSGRFSVTLDSDHNEVPSVLAVGWHQGVVDFAYIV